MATGDFNSDGFADLYVEQDNGDDRLLISNGDGSFQDPVELSGVGGIALRGEQFDFNNDGVVDLISTFRININQTTDGVAPLLEFSLTSLSDAKQALSRFSQKLDQLTEQRGQIGAFQSRIEVAENVLQVSAENFEAAESRIRDADIAQEAADLVRLQILQQSSVAVLGQANLQPQLVLELLAQ